MKQNELKEIFLAEAMEGYEELNKVLTVLEKDSTNKKAIDSVFRITHTLKANAAGMGYDDIAALSHTLEDVFSEIRNGTLVIESSLFNDLFKSIDFLGAMIHCVKDDREDKIKYKGLKTKLEALVRTTRFGPSALPENKFSTLNTLENKPEQRDNLLIPLTKTEDETADFSDKDVDIHSKVSFTDLIQIPVRKLDNLMNLVGELLIERDRIVTLVNGDGRKNEFTRLLRISSELQYSVMDVRLVQVNILFFKFHRSVRDVALIENKKVDLILEGADNEIDRNVLQIISESLVHLVRNAISHGIETPEERKKLGKPETGKIYLKAKSEKDSIIIETQDDGKGINTEIIKRKAVEKGIITLEYAKTLSEEEAIFLIFESGFSSAEEITSVSGRGVGMDVVKKSIDSIGGKISIKTKVGEGSTFSLSLPSSMALKGALLFTLGQTEYAIPLSYTESVIQIFKTDIHHLGHGLVTSHLGKNISIVFLKDVFGADTKQELFKKGNLHKSLKEKSEEEKLFVIVVSYNNKSIGFIVDRLQQQKEIVEKPLSAPLDKVEFISGATILGNGNVCLVLDIPSIINMFSKNYNQQYAYDAQ